MIKKLLFIPLMLSSALYSAAQISYTQQDLPTVGIYRGVENNGGTFQLPQTGPNKTWNYTNFTPGDTFDMSFDLPSSSPFKSKIPSSATLISNDDSGDGEFTIGFFSTGNKGLYVDGFYQPDEDSTLMLEKNQLIFPAPIGFGQTVSDFSRLVIQADNGIFSFKSVSHKNLQFEAVGWGSITTPEGTFPNTLLIKEVTITIDSTTTSFPFPQTNVDKDTLVTFRWIQKDASFPIVFELTVDEEGTGSSDVAYYKKSVLAGVEASLFSRQLVAYPSPADQSVTLETSGNISGEVLIFDLDGQLMMRQTVNNSSRITLETGNLGNGLYVCELKTKDGLTARKKLVVQR